MGIHGVSDINRANQYNANQKAKATASFGQQLSEATKQRMNTASAYDTGIQTGPLVAGTGTPAPREGVAVDTTQYADGLLTISRMAAPNVEPAPATAPVQEDTAAENNKTYYVEGGPTLIEQFGQKLLDAAAAPNRSMVIRPKDNSVCSMGYGIGGDQVVYAEYTADSTPEDPIVRILCQSHSGLYEFTRHINDIDPSNATYAELEALYGHLKKIGAAVPNHSGLGAVPSGYEIGDMMKRQNFLTGLDDLSRSKMFGPDIMQDAEAFFEFYSVLAKEKEAMEVVDAEFEALMAVVDNVIENKQVMEPKEILEKLSDHGKDVLEDMKNGDEVSRDRWDFLLTELHGMGAISNDELVGASAHLIPVGYKDEKGNFVMYEDVGLHSGLYDRLRSTSDNSIQTGIAQFDSYWSGDPLDFLDAWIENLQDWRDELAQDRKPSGEAKYDNFSPIDRQVEGASSVSTLIKNLLAEMP